MPSLLTRKEKEEKERDKEFTDEEWESFVDKSLNQTSFAIREGVEFRKGVGNEPVCYARESLTNEA